MIIYSKTLWGLPLLTRLYGSALPRAIAPAVISGLLTVALMLLGDRVAHLWQNPFAYQPFVLLVSFVLTFRSNYAYQRHWEAYTQISIMTARWVDAAVQIIMFDQHPTEPEHAAHHHQHQLGRRSYHPPSSRHSSAAQAAYHAGAASHAQFVADLVHLISLLHGVSCAALRRDPDLSNMKRHSRLSAAPPSDPALLDKEAIEKAEAAGQAETAPAGATGDDDEKEPNSPRVAAAIKQWAGHRDVNIVGGANWRDIFMLRGSSSAIRRYNAAQPLPVVGGVSTQEMAALGCRFGFNSDTDDDQALGLYTDDGWGGLVPGRFPRTAVVGTAGTSGDKHHQHRQHSATAAGGGGSFAASVSRFASGFSSSNGWSFLRNGQQQKQQQSEPFRLSNNTPAVRETSSYGVAGSTKSVKSDEFGHVGEGLRRRHRHGRRFKVSQNHTCCGMHLPYMDRPLLVLTWIHELLLRRQQEGGLRVPAPILARVHTCLSDGFLGFEQCRKLADTPFPFPWAQFVFMMLVLFTVTLPLLVLAYIPNHVLAVVLTVVTVSTYWAVNEVARDVEDPFLYEPNDMPLANGQYHMNEMLLALSSARRPASGVIPIHIPMAAGSAGSAAAAAAGLGVGRGSSGLPVRSAGSASWPNLTAQTVEASSERSDHIHDQERDHDGQKHDDLVEARDVNSSSADSAAAAAAMGERHASNIAMQQEPQARAAQAAAAAALQQGPLTNEQTNHSHGRGIRAVPQQWQQQQQDLELPNTNLHVTTQPSGGLISNTAAAATASSHNSRHPLADVSARHAPCGNSSSSSSIRAQVGAGHFDEVGLTATDHCTSAGDGTLDPDVITAAPPVTASAAAALSLSTHQHCDPASAPKSPVVSPAPAGPGAAVAAADQDLASSVRCSSSMFTTSKISESLGGGVPQTDSSTTVNAGSTSVITRGSKSSLGIRRSAEVADMV